MITTVKGDNVNDVFYYLCQLALGWPKEVRRGGVTMLDSPGPVSVEIHNPLKRVLNMPGRNNSLPAACAETLWVLAGRNDVEWLQFYLPRAPDFSDDGKTWRAGYGPRLRGTTRDDEDEIERCDQFHHVVWELKKDPTSRRAVIDLLEPPNDYTALHRVGGTKDFSCNLTLSFMVRGGKLDLVVFCRSQDLIWGASGINWFEFTVMQELVANMIGVPVGIYYHVTNNLHVYSRHFNLVEKMANQTLESTYNWLPPDYEPVKSIENMDDTLKSFFKIEEMIRRDPSSRIDIIELQEHDTFFDWNGSNTVIHDIAAVALTYCAWKAGYSPLSKRLHEFIHDEAMKESYDKHMAWLQRPKRVVPRMEEAE
jgi:thymidylate synthase